MDLKQNYRKETNLKVYAGTSEKYPSYSNKYVEWLEEQLRIGVVSQQRELLLAYEEWLNEYPTKKEMLKQVDKYLKSVNESEALSIHNVRPNPPPIYNRGEGFSLFDKVYMDSPFGRYTGVVKGVEESKVIIESHSPKGNGMMLADYDLNNNDWQKY